ncbi:MAG: pyrimidine dimer DNA glycosylase/endonuclease V [Deltaproteobacteria bacterium]|nr:pyrimidine dimer DNA glycosylase/endonuclease V [Deltaproteobacteria bacterium]
MNIFVLDTDITRCAQYHCDQHVSKMILESAQIMCTALHKQGFETPYKPTHTKHPCVLWVEKSHGNFIWLESLAFALNQEFKYRYDKDKDHASIQVVRKISVLSYENRGLTPFAQAMPEPYRRENDAVSAYRAYYRGEKAKFATWTKRPLPEWMKAP